MAAARESLALTRTERTRLAEIEAELAVLRLDGPSVIEPVLPTVRDLLATDVVMVFSPEERGDGLEVARFHTANLRDPEHARTSFARFFQTAPRRYAWYDAVRPEPEQRNRVLEAHELMGPGELERSAIYRQVLVPLRLHHHRQPRVLLCDGPSLLAWFGAFHPEPVRPRQRQLLSRLAAPMRRRLRLERRLAAMPLRHAALDTALEQLGAPAFVIDRHGAIRGTNTAGRRLLDEQPVSVRASLAERVRGRDAALAFDVTPLDERGVPRGFLAVLPAHTLEERVRAAVTSAAERWQLTARQREVLAYVLRGHANATIAGFLRISERAIEQHVSALIARAGVEHRAALVSCVLLGA